MERWTEFNCQQWRKWKTREQLLFLKRPTVTQCKSLLSPLLIPGMPSVIWEQPVCFQEKICFEEWSCCWSWAGFTHKHRVPKESWLWKPSGNTFYWVKDRMCWRMSRSTENIICGMSKRSMVNLGVIIQLTFRRHSMPIHIQCVAFLSSFYLHVP